MCKVDIFSSGHILIEKVRYFVFLLPVGTRQDSAVSLAVLILLILKDSLTNIRNRVLSPGRPSLGGMPHNPYYFLRAELHFSLLFRPSTCVCMCAVNAGGCVIDLLVQDWASSSSLLCLVTGTMQTQIIHRSPPVPYVYPRIWLRGFNLIKMMKK